MARTPDFAVKPTPAMLKWARVQKGWTIEEAASRLDIPNNQLHALETGSGDITYCDLVALAEKYRQPVASFFRGVAPPLKTSPPDRRSHKPDGEISLAGREAISTARRLQYLAGEIISEMDIRLPAFPVSAHLNADPADVAAKMRVALRISAHEQLSWPNENAALQAWRKAVEDLGVFVFQLKLPSAEFRGFSLSDTPACIIIGTPTIDSATGRAFSLFHEAAHLALRQSGLCNPFVEGTDKRQIEGWCNSFAGSLLMPPELLHETEQQLRSIPSDQAAAAELMTRLAKRFKVSRYALLTRVLVLGWMPRDQYFDLVEFMGLGTPERSFGRGGVPDELSAKRCLNRCGSMYVGLVLSGLKRGALDMGSATAYLSTRPENLGTLTRLVARK